MFTQDNTPTQDLAIPDHVVDDAATQGVSPVAQDWQHPGQPLDAPAGQPIQDVVAPQAPAASTGAPVDTNELLDIKQQALGQLSPLVDHLEQSPEEKFRTTMMMIQASDDQSLIKLAYEAAQAIPDEKARAQALLDVVNEINYFTQQHQG